jgi:predicted RNase H-like nuclease (RuvC/YqgF family)
VLKRLGTIYETLELYGKASECFAKSQKIFEEVKVSEAKRLAKKNQRINNKKSILERELAHLKEKEKRLEEELEISNKKRTGKSTRSELRILRRRCKRIRQKLGIEASQIRLGKKR